jgi:hypothetical protein
MSEAPGWVSVTLTIMREEVLHIMSAALELISITGSHRISEPLLALKKGLKVQAGGHKWAGVTLIFKLIVEVTSFVPTSWEATVAIGPTVPEPLPIGVNGRFAFTVSI